MTELTKNEEALMLAVLYLKENAYGINIRQNVSDYSGKVPNYGTLYRMLDQLVKKGLLIKKEGQPMAERGGRRKIFYSLTPHGHKALKMAHTLQKSLWAGYEDMAVADKS